MSVELRYTEPFSATILTRSVDAPGEVELFAADLLARYQAAGDVLPGIDLRRDAGDSMAVAVAPSGWALVHTDTDFDQHCTRGNGTDDDGTVEVRWEEPDSLPGSWFVPTARAVAAVARWMADGALTPDVTWSDQCL